MTKKGILASIAIILTISTGVLGIVFEHQVDQILNPGNVPYWLIALIVLTIGWMVYIYKRMKGE